jgi:hypothetical protein
MNFGGSFETRLVPWLKCGEHRVDWLRACQEDGWYLLAEGARASPGDRFAWVSEASGDRFPPFDEFSRATSDTIGGLVCGWRRSGDWTLLIMTFRSPEEQVTRMMAELGRSLEDTARVRELLRAGRRVAVDSSTHWELTRDYGGYTLDTNHD